VTKEKTSHDSASEGSAKTAPKWMDRNQIAEYYGVSVRTVSNLMSRRYLPYSKLGRIVRFDVQACDEAFKSFEIRTVNYGRSKQPVRT
jgi:excisionase family DNA binding protein